MTGWRKVLLVVLLMASLVATAAPTRREVVTDTIMAPTYEVFPGTVYDDYWSRTLHANATGSLLVDQPVNQKTVTFTLEASGLIPGGTYRVFCDWTGYDPETYSTIGGCQLMQVITADESGAITWVATPTLEPRYYTVAVILNYFQAAGPRVNRSILIAVDNAEFTINQ